MYERIELFVTLFAWFVGVPSFLVFVINLIEEWRCYGGFGKVVLSGAVTAVCWAWLISGWAS